MTDRLPFAAPDNWESFETQLRTVAGDALVRLDVLSENVRPELVKASRLSESLRSYDSDYHAELDWWRGGSDAYQGIPPSSLVSATESERVWLGGNVGRRVELAVAMAQPPVRKDSCQAFAPFVQNPAIPLGRPPGTTIAGRYRDGRRRGTAQASDRDSK